MGKTPHDDGDCPMTKLIGLISSKWAMPVIYNLLVAGKPMRFGKLKDAVGPITQRELSRTLKRFEQMGIVRRKVYAEVPLRVEYSLTPLGRTLREPILALGAWATQYAGKLAKSQEQPKGV